MIRFGLNPLIPFFKNIECVIINEGGVSMDIKKFFYINTFKDRRNRMVYFDHLKNNAFIIPKEEEAKFKTFQGRGLYSVAIFFLLYSYGISTLQMLLISIGFYTLTSDRKSVV